MKKQICLILLVAVSALGQPVNIGSGVALLPTKAVEPPKLTKFNLDFPGGTPKQLVAAIEKATGRPLNVVIPDEYADEPISALRMTQVTVSDLFRAMELASIKTTPYRTSIYAGAGSSYQQIQTTISFQTSGTLSDDSIWYFRGRQQPPDLSFLETKPSPKRISRFYALTPYLEHGLKVEDITTAVQTGWKMLGDTETPNISFHTETKLLIAVGEAEKLETIDAVLKALSSKTSFKIDPSTGLPVQQEADFTARLNSIIKKAAQVAPDFHTNSAPLKPVITSERQP